MNEYVQKYQRIVDKLIKKSFPELKQRKIKISERNFKNKLSGISIKMPFFRIIVLDFHVRNYSYKLLIGLLSHELSHLSMWEKYLFNYYFIFLFKTMSKKFIRKNEWNIDISSINRGYAHELYLQRKDSFLKKKNSPFKKNYASPEQIKSYAKEIGKW